MRPLDLSTPPDRILIIKPSAVGDVVHGLPTTIGFIISKGGITSNDMLSKGLALPTARLAGQILAGCSVVLTPADHLFPEIPVVIFPGNVGDANALTQVWQRLSTPKPRGNE